MKTLLALSSILLIGCGSVSPATVQAARTANSRFNGRYIFKSSGFQKMPDGTFKPFTEAGTVIADGLGHYKLTSWMNTLDDTEGLQTDVDGSYAIDDALLTGTAQQTVGTQVNDRQTILISLDGKHIIMESKDINFTWTAELTRD